MKILKNSAAFMLALILCACGSGTPTVTVTPVPTRENAVSGTDYTPVAAASAGTASAEITAADIFDNKIQIDGNVYTFPMTVGEFETASGFVLSDPDETAEPYSTAVRAAFKPDSDISFKVSFVCENSTENELSKRDCVIRCMYLSFSDRTNRVFLPGGFGTDMTKEAFAAKFGEGIEYDGSLNTHYYQDSVMSDERDMYSGTGREVSYYISDGRLKEYTASFTLDKPDQRIRSFSVNAKGEQADISAKCTFELPESFFVKPFSDASSYTDVGGKYTNGELTGDLSLVISNGMYLNEYGSEKDIEKEYKNEKIAYKAKTDDKEICFISYDNNKYKFYGTAVVYDKNTGIAADIPVSFYTNDNYNSGTEKDMLNYTAALLSTMSIEKTE
ncbi:MAG: hypothetical protein IKS17_07455 [Firmicutes bacterium]|nr:hypothetical protein [Bacillota bacterium]